MNNQQIKEKTYITKKRRKKSLRIQTDKQTFMRINKLTCLQIYNLNKTADVPLYNKQRNKGLIVAIYSIKKIKEMGGGGSFNDIVRESDLD